MRKQHYVSRALASLLFLFTAATGFAQTGVSDNRVSLPEGSGGVDGFADNAQVSGNQGAMSFSVTIQTPNGTGGVTPNIGLSYSSNGGNGLAGMGWSFGLPSIERSSAKGLAQYNDTDRFVENGSSELVFVGEAGQHREYRARYEGSFNRYRWHNSGEGKEGYWTVESAGGLISYYGASSDGTLAPQARMGRSDIGTFKYHVREVVDAFGNKAVYSYLPADDMVDGSTRLISQIDYTFDRQGENPRYSVRFTYEDRDDVMSDCKAGYCELMSKRLKTISIVSVGTEIRTYELAYEELGDQADLSRLREVRRYGIEDALFPGRYEFEYQKSLGMGCMGGMCAEPYFTDIANSVGANLRAGSATLIDINGDALPDVVNTQNEEHLFYINQLELDGTQSFTASERSGLAAASEFNLSRRRVQTLDVNGDGFSDIVDYSSQVYLKNLGQGDWDSTQSLVAGAGYPQDSVFEDSSGGDGGQLDNLRFFDYDNDKLIDLLYITESSTQIYRTLPNGGTEAVDGVDQVSADFGGGFEVGVQLTDVNGDGLQDLVKVEPQEFIYRLYLGYGRWTPATRISIPAVTQDLVPSVELEDMNGDSLTDLVVVYDGELQYSLNQNGNAFSEWVTISSVNGRSLPEISESTVLYADMNGNGSVDVVWFDGNGSSTYLELFPERPNLLSQITNNLGKVTKVTYDSSVRERLRSAQAGNPWAYRLPHPATLVVEKEIYDGVNDVSEVLTYDYQNGYYDGQEKQFRGYGVAEIGTQPNAFQSAGVETQTFNLGIDDHYFNGLRLSKSSYSIDADTRVLLAQTTDTYADCDVAGIPSNLSGDQAIRSICKTQTDVLIVEGMPDEQIKKSTLFEYDGYGNLTKTQKLGVVSVGGGACGACTRASDLFGEPCGAECTGDEHYEDKVFTVPGDALGQWRHDLLVSTTDYADAASPNKRIVTTFYDGEAFVGLPNGGYDKGRVHRVSALSKADESVDTERYRFDDWGNKVQELKALDDTTDQSGLVRAYDSYGQFLEDEATFFTDENGEPYTVHSQLTYDLTWSRIATIVDSAVDKGGETIVPGELFEYSYDDHGRLKEVYYPSNVPNGPRDAQGKPSVSYEYKYNNPVTEMIVRHRSESGGDIDRTHVKCVDGFGRIFQERVSIGNGQFQVSGFMRRNPRGNVVEHYKAYLSDSAACEQSAPQDVLKVTTTYDALSRELITTLPDADVFGGVATVREYRHEPLKKLFFDELDTEEGGYAANTPRISHIDGLGRLYRVERFLESGGTAITHEVFYDDFSNIKGYRDPAGHERLQIFDRLGRLLRISDPDFGMESYIYNANGDQISSTDARGMSMVFEADSQGRPIARYEEGNREETLIQYFYDFPRECPASKCTSTGDQMVEVHYPLGELGTGKTWFGYNGRNTGLYVAKQIGTALFETQSEVNNVEEVTADIFPGGQRIEYIYRGDGKLSSIPGYIDEVSFDQRGQTTSVSYHNGVVENYTFDSRDHLTRINANTASGSAFVDQTITRDRKGNVTEVLDAIDSGRFGHSAQYSFDALYRLKTAELGSAESTESLIYEYDTVDNIVSKVSNDTNSPAHVGAYTYSETQPHAVITAGDTDYLYDDSGYMVSRGEQAYDWNYRGLLSDIRDSDGELIGRNYYGEQGKRVVKEENGSVSYYVSSKYEVRDGVGIIYVQIGKQRLAVKIEQNARVDTLSDLAPFSSDDSVLSPNGDGVITAGDAYASHLITESVLSIDDGVEVSAVKTLLNSSARRLLALEASAQDKVSYYHYDHIMNNIAVTDEAGEVAHQYSYYPFLALKDSTGGASEDQRVANGKETDQMTGLTDYGARYADLKLGRFISPDRYFDVVGSETVFASPQEATGAYIFTNNNPVSSIDQDGRFVSNIIGAVVGAVATAALEIRQYRADKALGVPKTGWDIAASVAKTIVLGAGVGFLTSGASAIGTVAQLATEVHQRRRFERKGNDPKVAEAKARVRGGIVGAVVGAVTSGVFAATGAVAAMNSLGSTGSGVMVRMAEGLSTTAKVSLSTASTMLTAGGSTAGAASAVIKTIINQTNVYKAKISVLKTKISNLNRKIFNLRSGKPRRLTRSASVGQMSAPKAKPRVRARAMSR